MEVFLSKESVQALSALQCSLSNTNSDGFLIGHKRGDMFFVEKVIPSQKDFYSSRQNYFELSKKIEDRILGFYSFHTTENKLKKILTPLGYGKVFLRLDRDDPDQLDIKPFAIEHDQDFFLLPIILKSAR